jgi:uncharacterized protein (DUF2235 family)
MGRNIVLCSDGTGNTFDSSVSNVTRMIRLLALDDRAAQVVAYDQGIGTSARRLADVERYRATVADGDALRVLPGPRQWRFEAAGWPARVAGLLAGYGLAANVRELYRELGRLCSGPTDRIFLFGFSRGAFTVRALAGLVYRCGLPTREAAASDGGFEAVWRDAWRLYTPRVGRHRENGRAVDAFRRRFGQQDGGIHFMGVWDTVKSYGGLIPVSLPHLRHNPIVRTVRHALALDEHRAWFDATTWGQLDLDAGGARRRLRTKDLARYRAQDIDEVWFRGCHSDVGGGDAEAVTASIALRWMLGEAAGAGLRLNAHGEAALACDDPPHPPEIHESFSWAWRCVEGLPRLEIDNSGLYPVKRLAWGHTGRRAPDALRRQGTVVVHVSAGDGHAIPPPVETRRTRGHPHPRPALDPSG